ncbi:MAG: bacteriophage holin [Acidobacteriota bacterium]|nr:bacteriophage holin [Acidobacteriota bacterium]
MELNKTALGLATGIVWGLGVFVATVWVATAGGGETMALLRRFYLWYTPSYPGALIGLVWGFIDGFIGGWLVALLYNTFARRAAAV